jgi:thiosulfate/3-mercaptopyruvate sulfurtransferase
MNRQVAVLLLVFANLACLAQTAQAHPEMLVSTQWLADHLKDPNVVVLHVAEKRNDYEKGHIAGARYLGFDDFMDVHAPKMYELPSPEKLKAVFEKLGISDNTHVVIYTQDWFPWASRAWFTFEYLGHGSQAALLDGGYKQWENEKRPTTKDEPGAAAQGKFTPHPNPNIVAQLQQVKPLSEAGGNDGKLFLVDARSAKRYSDGHFSGATNIFWRSTVASENAPTLLPVDQLRKLWTDAGFKPGEKSVSYCEVGIQASHDYFVAKYIGFDAEMYDGSVHEWEMLEKLPYVKGSGKTGPLVPSKGDMMDQ